MCEPGSFSQVLVFVITVKSVLSFGSLPSHSCPHPSLQLSVSGALVLLTDAAMLEEKRSLFIGHKFFDVARKKW